VAYDSVSYNGSSYVALASSTNVAPDTDASKWDLLAQGQLSSNFVDLSSAQTIGGAKTFSSTVVGNISGSAGTITGTITKSQVSDFPTLATVATTGSYGDLLNRPALAASIAASSNKFLDSYDASTGTFSAAQPGFSDLSGSLAATQMPALTGDVTTSAGSNATTLATSGVGAGTYTAATITVDAKGRVTSASSNSIPDVGATAVGGDLTGTVAGATVAKINGSALGTLTGATSGQTLSWDGSAWAPATPVVNAAASLVGSSGNNSLTTATNGECFFVGIGAAVTTATACTTNNVLTQIPMPVAGTVRTFYVNAPTLGATGHADEITFTFRKNGVATAATCTPTTTANTCSVIGLSVEFAAGDLVDVSVMGNASSPPAPGVVTWGVSYQ
jgi:hypothetical protein